VTVLRTLTTLDRALIRVDEALRLSAGAAPPPARANPAGELSEPVLEAAERRHVAGLMRVNHSGEICAQALYAGQAATARTDTVRSAMQQAAAEEIDHLAWCEARLRELDSHTSALNPLWYAGSFAIGALAGLTGDRWSLGFVRETEQQVEAHLQDHIDRLPAGDARSQAILDQMQRDEARHAEMAETAGGRELPRPVRRAMALAAGVMKALAYRI
jgi:ubiquinone biosynthesis monooxygenase Coq7